MKHKLVFYLAVFLINTSLFAQDAEAILDKVDRNLTSENRVFDSEMIIHGRRNERTISARTYSVGDKKSFTEYLAPPREKGTKMLKLEDQLWIYSPSTDRIIQISGHMLRQSVMGSDLSYEDMMEDEKLTEKYSPEMNGEEEIDGRNTYVLELTAKKPDVAYYKIKMWIDRERYVPLREDLYAKSGQLLKRTTLSEVKQISGKWFPTKIVFKDMLKDGDGTEFRMSNIKFNQKIPDYIFTKAALKK